MWPLEVKGKNIRRGGNTRVSFLEEMYTDVYGVSVHFLQEKKVLVSNCIYQMKVLFVLLSFLSVFVVQRISSVLYRL